jgi:hypothetical protein
MSVYTSYILRVWRVKEGQRWAWRAMLERVSTGERVGFTDLASLVTFLQADAGEAVHAVDAANAGEDIRG